MSFKHLLPLLFLITTPVAILATETPAVSQHNKTELEEKLGPAMDKDESLPLVDEGTINFIGGKVIEYYKRRQLHEKPLDAYRKQEPIYYRENVVKINKWQRVAVIKFMSFFEGSRSEIRLYDFNGILINKATEFRGEVIIATPSDRILLGQRAKNYNLDKSILLDKNGRLVAELPHAPNAFKFGSSDDGYIFWILSALVRDGQPRTQITVFDNAGLLLHTWETEKAQPVGFKYKDKQYKFDVPAPK
ncbi:MAG: hypothetical protein ACC635_00780 [Acidiferrobacterales bacterium]